jgi:hypothetical protein
MLTDPQTLVWYDTDRIKTTHPTVLLLHVFVAAGMCLPSRCLRAMWVYTYRHTDWWEGFMKYVVELGSSTITNIPNFIKIGSDIQKLVGADTHTDTRARAHTHTHTHTHTGRWSHKPTFIFLNKESWLKNWLSIVWIFEPNVRIWERVRCNNSVQINCI